jgi:chitodextrinase/predicted chitinase
MSRLRVAVAVSTIAVTGVAAAVLSMTSASAATCAQSWSSNSVYWGGTSVSYDGRNYRAKWWTQSENPAANPTGVWESQGTCSGGSPSGGSSASPQGSCSAPAWVARKQYSTGDVVTYTDGKLYIAEHDNPGYDPTISTWYWDPHTCGSASTPTGTTAPTSPEAPVSPAGFVVSQDQFEQMFPNRNSFYTYSGLVKALSAYPAFANTGSDTVKKQEAAAFLANINHETGGLVHTVEQNTANYPHYCDPNQSFGCPAGQAAYYGRGPIQLSWNYNYKAAGDALGIDLLNEPGLVQTDASVAWKTGIWYWMTRSGPGTMTGHQAMVNGNGFGETIRSINGSLECDGKNTAQVQSRVAAYEGFARILGVSPGANLAC